MSAPSRLHVCAIVAAAAMVLSATVVAAQTSRRPDPRAPQPVNLAELQKVALQGAQPAATATGPGVGPAISPAIFKGTLATLPREKPFKGVSVEPPDPGGDGQSASASSPRPSRGTRPETTLPGSTGALQAGSANFDTIPNVNGVFPPDPSGDIGLNDYVQTVNDSFAIFDRSGTVLAGPTRTTALWSSAGASGLCARFTQGDGTTRYDRWADRFVITTFAFKIHTNPDGTSSPQAPFDECIAVSQTGDPVAGGWFLYDVPISTSRFNDFPKFGLWPDGYYLTFNMDPGSGQGSVFVLDRTSMLSGSPARSVCFGCDADGFGRLGGADNLLPADSDGPLAPPAGTPETLVRFSSPLIGAQSLQQWLVHVDWTDPTASTLSQLPDVPVPAFNPDVPLIPEPGSSNGLDTLSDRLSNRAVYLNLGTREELLLNHTVVETPPGGGSMAGLRWYQLLRTQQNQSLPPLTFTVQQSGDFAPDSLNRWIGSIASDRGGDIALGYSVSGPQQLPSIVAAGRKPGDPAGQLTEGELTLVNGPGFQFSTGGRNRWGDYSSLNLDPTDSCTFWYTNEYLRAGASATNTAPWQVHVGSFSFTGCQDNATVTTLSAPTSQFFGAPVTLRAHVSSTAVGAGTPTGVVVFFNGPSELGAANLSGGNAVLRTSAMLPADHSITAMFIGSGVFEPSTSDPFVTTVKCSQSVTGTDGNITLSSGAVCVSGSFHEVHVRGAATAVSVSGASFADLDTNGAKAVAICSSTATGTITLTNTSELTEVGDGDDDGPPACAGNSFKALFVSGSQHGVEVGGNTAVFPSGLIVLALNHGGEPAPDDAATEVEGNHAFGILCEANDPAPGNGGIGNTVTISIPFQQCSGF